MLTLCGAVSIPPRLARASLSGMGPPMPAWLMERSGWVATHTWSILFVRPHTIIPICPCGLMDALQRGKTSNLV